MFKIEEYKNGYCYCGSEYKNGYILYFIEPGKSYLSENTDLICVCSECLNEVFIKIKEKLENEN